MYPLEFLFAYLLFQVSLHDHAWGMLWPNYRKSMACQKPCSGMDRKMEAQKVLCSCNRSCLQYGDCCYDSKWKNIDVMKEDLLCIHVGDFGDVSVVKSCPKSTTDCQEGLNSGLPVTSFSTGTSYVNSRCALCNDDVDNLTTWPVVLKCCREYYHKGRSEQSRFVYHLHQRIWDVREFKNGTRVFCECKLYLPEAERDVMEKLELRSCQRKEISTCSPSFRIESVREFCGAYLDPVYSRDRMYRNKHCALCNFERLENLKCTPEFQDIISSYGLSSEESYRYCNSYGLEACLAFLNRRKGRGYGYPRLFYIEDVGCIPSNGRRCCDGERYIPKYQQCMKIQINPVGSEIIPTRV